MCARALLVAGGVEAVLELQEPVEIVVRRGFAHLTRARARTGESSLFIGAYLCMNGTASKPVPQLR